MDHRIFKIEAEILVDRISSAGPDITSKDAMAEAAGVTLYPDGRHWGEKAKCSPVGPAPFEFSRDELDDLKPHVIKELRARKLNYAREQYCGQCSVRAQCLIDDFVANYPDSAENIRYGLWVKPRRELYKRLVRQANFHRGVFLKKAVGE